MKEKGCVQMENTLVIIKPDAVANKLVGRIISMYEENGLYLEGMYISKLDKKALAEHYAEHVDRDFYSSLIEFMTESEVVVLKLSGENAIELVREINGATNPSKARAGTIRALFAESVQRNSVHGSANKEDAERELNIWF